MNTQSQVRKLQSGEAIALPGHRQGHLVLIEGEVMFQAPAVSLAGMVFLQPERHASAPASLPLAEIGSLRATRGATILIEEAPGLFATAWAALGPRLARWFARRPRGHANLAS